MVFFLQYSALQCMHITAIANVNNFLLKNIRQVGKKYLLKFFIQSHKCRLCLALCGYCCRFFFYFSFRELAVSLFILFFHISSYGHIIHWGRNGFSFRPRFKHFRPKNKPMSRIFTSTFGFKPKFLNLIGVKPTRF